MIQASGRPLATARPGRHPRGPAAAVGDRTFGILKIEDAVEVPVVVARRDARVVGYLVRGTD